MICLSSLTAGQTINAGYGGWRTPCEFLGFTDNAEASSRTLAFNTLADLKTATGTRNAAEIEQLQDHACDHGFYALFRDLKDDAIWGAYLWKGVWRVGSSADRLQIAACPAAFLTRKEPAK